VTANAPGSNEEARKMKEVIINLSKDVTKTIFYSLCALSASVALIAIIYLIKTSPLIAG